MMKRSTVGSIFAAAVAAAVVVQAAMVHAHGGQDYDQLSNRIDATVDADMDADRFYAEAIYDEVDLSILGISVTRNYVLSDTEGTTYVCQSHAEEKHLFRVVGLPTHEWSACSLK